jgi:hypothetical protein
MSDDDIHGSDSVANPTSIHREVLPCPWGHIGQLVIKVDQDQDKFAAWVECEICLCRGVWAGWYQTQLIAAERAVKYWNNRPNVPLILDQ